jgi:hypothetical protein
MIQALGLSSCMEEKGTSEMDPELYLVIILE